MLQMNGELTWVELTLLSEFIGDITYAPITTYPTSDFWGISASITYAISSSTAGITDTGTTLVMIATDAFDRYQQATGGVADEATGLLKITSNQYANLKNIFVHVNGVPLELLTRNAQI